MKRISLVIIMICCCLITGCFGNTKNDRLKEIKNKYENLKSYEITGNLEIVNNDDTYNYDVKAIYQKKDKYFVSLKNKANSHEQIILKNEDGVYVLTPSLNKSFKFQSDWPYDNSQIYLIDSILDDILDDDKRDLVEDKDNYIFTTAVNYPNNRKLVKQNVVFDKKCNLKKVVVLNENDIPQMTMEFKTIDLKPEISSDQFNINKIMGINNELNKSKLDNNTDSTPNPTTDTKTTSSLSDTIYPLYIPNGTFLTNEEKIDKTDGERVIMTFDGEKPFLLVEETASISDELSIIPTYGEPYLLIDTVGALSDNSISWDSNGVEYYLVSEVMSQDELLDIARSVNAIPTIK